MKKPTRQLHQTGLLLASLLGLAALPFLYACDYIAILPSQPTATAAYIAPAQTTTAAQVPMPTAGPKKEPPTPTLEATHVPSQNVKSLKPSLLYSTAAATGHTNWVFELAFSPDGRYLASSGDQTVKLWSTGPGGQLVRNLAGYSGEVNNLEFSPDSKLLATGDGNPNQDRARLWEVETGRQIADFPNGQLHFSPDGKTLAIFSMAGLKLWDVTSHQTLPDLPNAGEQIGLAEFSPDGRLLAGSNEQVTWLWEVSSRRLLATLPHGGYWQIGFAFSPDSQRLALAGQDNQLELYATKNGQLLAKWPSRQNQLNTHLLFSPDGQTLLSGNNSGQVEIWNLAQLPPGPPNQTLKLGGAIAGLKFSADGHLLVTNNNEQNGQATLKLWDWPSGKLLTSLEKQIFISNDITLSHDGKLLAGYDNHYTVKIWQTANGQLQNQFAGEAGVNGVAWSSDGQTIAAAFTNNVVKTFQASDGQAGLTLSAGPNQIGGGLPINSNPLVFSPDNKWLVRGDDNGRLQIWDMQAKEHPLNTVSAHFEWFSGKPVTGLAFGPDGQLFSAGDDNFVKTWRMGSDESSQNYLINKPDPNGYNYSLNGLIIAQDGDSFFTFSNGGAGSNHPVQQRDSQNGHVLHEFGSGSPTTSAIALSRDGKTLAVAGNLYPYSQVLLYEVATGRELIRFQTNTNQIKSLAFSADGKQIFSASENGELSEWEAFTGAPLLTLPITDTAGLTSLSLSPDGTRLLTGQRDGAVKVWQLR